MVSVVSQPGAPGQRTTYPMVTGGSIVGLKYAGGVMVAADTIASYGSLVRYDGVLRMAEVGIAKDCVLAAGGDHSDYQYMLKIIDQKATTDFAIDDGASLSPAALHSWLTRIMYQRRSKMDPLWNRCVHPKLCFITPHQTSAPLGCHHCIELSTCWTLAGAALSWLATVMGSRTSAVPTCMALRLRTTSW